MSEKTSKHEHKMKSFIFKHGLAVGIAVGSLFGIATAGAIYFGYKPVCSILVVIVIALVIASERMRAEQIRKAKK